MSDQKEKIIVTLFSLVQCMNCHQKYRILDLIGDDYLASWSSVGFLPDFTFDATLSRGQRVYRCPRNNILLAKREEDDRVILISERAIKI